MKNEQKKKRQRRKETKSKESTSPAYDSMLSMFDDFAANVSEVRSSMEESPGHGYEVGDMQCAPFYSVTIKEKQAQAGLVCGVQSSDKSKFKVSTVNLYLNHKYLFFYIFYFPKKPKIFLQLLYFDQEENGGLKSLNLALQEDSAKTGKVTSAGMYFLGFSVYRLDPPSNSVSYTIEVLCTEAFVEEKESLRAVEAQILSKRLELSKFEFEYKQVLAKFTEMTGRYTQEMQAIDELLTQRNEIHASYTTVSPIKRTSRNSSSSGGVEVRAKGVIKGRWPSKSIIKGKKKEKEMVLEENLDWDDIQTCVWIFRNEYPLSRLHLVLELVGTIGDAATVANFLIEYGLIEFKLNIECNHATLSGHSCHHELKTVRINGLLGNIDAIGTQIRGLAPGGFNFDAKLRRESTDIEDLFIAHIAGMDTLARGLRNAAKLLEDGSLGYSSFDSPLGAQIEAGKADFELLEKKAMEWGEPIELAKIIFQSIFLSKYMAYTKFD
ncbi:hypothetical protein LXL04_039310 [Taraxacum kok-saghyz]